MEDAATLQVLTLDGELIRGGYLEESKARGVSFFDNNHVILRVSETTSTIGFRGDYEYWVSFAQNIETGEYAQLPRRVDELFPAQSGLGRLIGDSDRDGWVLMPAYIGPRYADPEYELLRVRLETGRGIRYARGTADTIDWFTGKGGKVLARERYSNKRNMYRIQVAKGRGSWTTIYEQESDIPPLYMAGVMPDESGLVFVETNSFEGGFDSLMKLGFDGEISGPVLGREGREIDAVITDRNRAVLGVRYGGLEPDYDFLDERLQAANLAINESLPNATIYMDSWSDDRSLVLYRVFEPTVGDIWLTQKTATNELNLLADARPDIGSEHLGQLYAIRYEASDGLSIPGIVTAPAGQSFEETRNAPAIILPHGGPASYDRFDFDWMAQYFASRGYLVLQPNFRGSTGYGEAFKDAGIGEWGGKMLSDIDDGLAALIRDERVDPNRVCTVGLPMAATHLSQAPRFTLIGMHA